MAVDDTTAAPADKALNTLLAYRLSQLIRVYNRHLARYLSSAAKISPAEWFILAHLGEHSPRTLRWIANTTLLDKGQLSRAAAALVEKGYISKAPDPNDARSALFSISPAGEKLRKKVMDARVDLNDRLDSLMTAEERRVLEQALEKMTAFFLADDPASQNNREPTGS